MNITGHLAVSCLMANAALAQPAEAPPATQPDEAPASEAAPAAEVAASKPPIGWLSDPDAPAKGPFEALVSGKIHFDDRLRLELADTTGKKQSTALTNRIRLGYESKPYWGVSGFVEMENVSTPTPNDYYVPATGDGSPDHTVIADPRGTEVNQAYGRYRRTGMAGSEMSLDIKAGRQRIKLDDDRFIGNVGWRQFEQTFDSVSVQSNRGIEKLSVFYAYVWGVQRIFGPDGPNPDSDSHLINVSYEALPELKITPFVYLLDFEDDDPTNSVNNYGVRLTGELWRDGGDEDVYVDYALTYARQTDAGDNPVDFEVDFIGAQARLARQGLGSVTAGYQLLGSDDGKFGFRFPLGTNHAFQGFADQFLTTPADGLQDLYLTGALEMPWGVQSAVTYHQFWSDEGGEDLGHEIDLVASKKLHPNWSVLVKAALFDGHNGQPDTTRFWVQTEVKF